MQPFLLAVFLLDFGPPNATDDINLEHFLTCQHHETVTYLTAFRCVSLNQHAPLKICIFWRYILVSICEASLSTMSLCVGWQRLEQRGLNPRSAGFKRRAVSWWLKLFVLLLMHITLNNKHRGDETTRCLGCQQTLEMCRRRLTIKHRTR